MQIVVDASIVLAILLNEPEKSVIIEMTKDIEIVSPASLAWEVGNALSANVKKNRITHQQAVDAILDYRNINVRLVDVDLEKAIHISNKYNIYAYDAYVLACASNLKIPLLCLDAAMIKLAKLVGVKTLEVV